MTTFGFMFMCIFFSILYLGWGFIYLPHERWQMLASIPLRRNHEGHWEGINLTFYGFLSANAYLLSIAVLVFLLSSVSVPLSPLFSLALCLLGVCVPASSLIARWVEGKAHTFTVGGAVFIGIISAPWIITGINRISVGFLNADPLPLLPCLAAMGIAYAFGEGFGRLACISFGCCYGRTVSASHPLFQHLFSRFNLVFGGATKKVSYAGHLEGQPLVPVQALTAVLYVSTALTATALFLYSYFLAAFILCGITTQGWRIVSETMRADYRGEQKFSAYQWMGLISIIYISLIGVFNGWLSSALAVSAPQIGAGLSVFWNPAVLLTLQVLWLMMFLYTGCSSVTGSNLSFHVRRERV
ncbi:MAG: prolipoprotein diacylglyceryl transferase [Desulfuromonadaceae bacterium]